MTFAKKRKSKDSTPLKSCLRLIGLLALVSPIQAEFSNCAFNFGVDWSQHVAKNCGYYRPNCTRAQVGIPAGIDFMQMFLGWTQVNGQRFAPRPEQDKEGQMLGDAKALTVTPVWVSYIIAEGAKLKLGVGDCNVPTGNGTLCTKGAQYIRDNRATILQQYKGYATFAAKSMGTKPIIWAMEPDYVQYTVSSTEANKQVGGALSNAEAKALLTDIIDTIKTYNPSAIISMDISPWINQATWLPAGVPLDKVTYMNTSGGISKPTANIKPSEATWKSVWNATSKGIIADDGYGTGGGVTSPNAAWMNATTLDARIKDGVIGLMVAVPGSGWASTIATLRTQITAPLLTCGSTPTPPPPPPTPTPEPVPARFALTITPPQNGSVIASPVIPTEGYTSATAVTLTATAASGYKFGAWTGACASITVNSCKITMDAAKTVGATFQKVVVGLAPNAKASASVLTWVSRANYDAVQLQPQGLGPVRLVQYNLDGQKSVLLWEGQSDKMVEIRLPQQNRGARILRLLTDNGQITQWVAPR